MNRKIQTLIMILENDLIVSNDNLRKSVDMTNDLTAKIAELEDALTKLKGLQNGSV